MTGPDWDKIRQQKLSSHTPSGWPENVRAISMEGLSLLGIHERTGKLYWDGQEIATTVGLRRYEKVLATIGALCAVVGTIIALVKLLHDLGYIS